MNQIFKTKKFKINDKVILKNYELWGDYQAHRGQVATIIKDRDSMRAGGFDYSLQWSDGKTSNAHEDNLRQAEWDDETND